MVFRMTLETYVFSPVTSVNMHAGLNIRNCMPVSRDLADRMGTPFLQETLNSELGRHIQETLPSIRNSLRTKMLEMKRELNELKDTSSPTAARNELMQ